jgi:hypothetical protein
VLLEDFEESVIDGDGVARPVGVVRITQDQGPVVVGQPDEMELAHVLPCIDRWSRLSSSWDENISWPPQNR